MRFGADYDKALQGQRTVEATLLTPCKPIEVAQLIRAWIEIVAYKRELRGVPRLKASDGMSQLKSAATALPRHAPLELDATEAKVETKESLSPNPVTAPPTPKPPSAIG
jgi:hypothetical protein